MPPKGQSQPDSTVICEPSRASTDTSPESMNAAPTEPLAEPDSSISSPRSSVSVSKASVSPSRTRAPIPELNNASDFKLEEKCEDLPTRASTIDDAYPAARDINEDDCHSNLKQNEEIGLNVQGLVIANVTRDHTPGIQTDRTSCLNDLNIGEQNNESLKTPVSNEGEDVHINDPIDKDTKTNAFDEAHGERKMEVTVEILSEKNDTSSARDPTDQMENLRDSDAMENNTNKMFRAVEQNGAEEQKDFLMDPTVDSRDIGTEMKESRQEDDHESKTGVDTTGSEEHPNRLSAHSDVECDALDEMVYKSLIESLQVTR